jgi:hypothetical protein
MKFPMSANFIEVAHTQRVQIAFLVLLYLVAWLSFNQWHSVPFASIETDGFEQLAQAQTVFTSEFVRNVIHPEGYAVAIWMVARIIPDWFVAAKLVSGIAGLVFLVTIFKLSESVFDSGTAFVTALLVVVNFFFVAYANLVQSDMLGVALAQLGIYLLITSSSNRLGRAVAGGLLFGIAGYVRIVYLALGGLVIVVALLDSWAKRSFELRRAGAVLIGLGIGIAPLLILNYVWFGRFWVDENFRNAAAYIYGSAYWDKFTSLLETVLYNPRIFFFTYFRRMLFDQPLLMGHVVGYALFLGFAGWFIALTQGRASRQSPGRIIWVCSIGLYMLTLPMGSSELRYFILLVPFTIAGSVYLIEHFVGLKSVVGIVMLIALLLSNLALIIPNLSNFQAERAPEFATAAREIRESSDAETVTLVSQPQAGYLTGHKYIDYRNVARDRDLEDVVSEYRLKYIIVDERYGVGHYPLFARLIEPSAAETAYPWLKPIYVQKELPRIIVYKVLKSNQR